MADRDDLWKLLVVISARKVVALKKHVLRKKRGGGQVRGESIFLTGGENPDAGIAEVVGNTPTPEFAARVAEESDRLLAVLDSELRQIAQRKLEGYTNADIARQLGRSERAVERKLHRIRLQWSSDKPEMSVTERLHRGRRPRARSR